MEQFVFVYSWGYKGGKTQVPEFELAGRKKEVRWRRKAIDYVVMWQVLHKIWNQIWGWGFSHLS